MPDAAGTEADRAELSGLRRSPGCAGAILPEVYPEAAAGQPTAREAAAGDEHMTTPKHLADRRRQMAVDKALLGLIPPAEHPGWARWARALTEPERWYCDRRNLRLGDGQ